MNIYNKIRSKKMSQATGRFSFGNCICLKSLLLCSFAAVLLWGGRMGGTYFKANTGSWAHTSAMQPVICSFLVSCSCPGFITWSSHTICSHQPVFLAEGIG